MDDKKKINVDVDDPWKDHKVKGQFIGESDQSGKDSIIVETYPK